MRMQTLRRHLFTLHKAKQLLTFTQKTPACQGWGFSLPEFQTLQLLKTERAL